VPLWLTLSSYSIRKKINHRDTEALRRQNKSEFPTASPFHCLGAGEVVVGAVGARGEVEVAERAGVEAEIVGDAGPRARGERRRDALVLVAFLACLALGGLAITSLS
jgi:hypothetical protein